VLRVIIYQGSVSIIVALVFLSLNSTTLFPSLYGGLVSIINTLLLARSVNAAGKAASEQEQTRGALVLVKSVVTRFALVLVSFYVGIVYLKLAAIEILVAFILAQLGYVFYKSKNIY
jgi:hypothetical protein